MPKFVDSHVASEKETQLSFDNKHTLSREVKRELPFRPALLRGNVYDNARPVNQWTFMPLDNVFSASQKLFNLYQFAEVLLI